MNMTTAAAPIHQSRVEVVDALPSAAAPTVWRQALSNRRVLVGGGILLAVAFVCLITLLWTAGIYHSQNGDLARQPPRFRPVAGWFGYDTLGRSILARCLMGGVISLAVGIAAASLAVALGVTVGLIAGYRGGWIDSVLMRAVDVLYGLPYVLLIILFKIAFEDKLAVVIGASDKPNAQGASVIILFLAIGAVSWLTMARVIRGQVLSLRSQPFIEACRAMGLKETRIFLRHILPNLVGPITVYATLTVPSAILQESFLSFLGVGINPPLPTWGNLASEAVEQLYPKFHWWMLVFPCTLLAVTLLSLNFVGDGLRDLFDPKKEAAKI
jgi:oligopeptide transport system permease protein